MNILNLKRNHLDEIDDLKGQLKVAQLQYETSLAAGDALFIDLQNTQRALMDFQRRYADLGRVLAATEETLRQERVESGLLRKQLGKAILAGLEHRNVNYYLADKLETAQKVVEAALQWAESDGRLPGELREAIEEYRKTQEVKANG